MTESGLKDFYEDKECMVQRVILYLLSPGFIQILIVFLHKVTSNLMQCRYEEKPAKVSHFYFHFILETMLEGSAKTLVFL